ncbi:MAG TPA: choice-of-anchor L domain-containing protein [Edaphocola sp.]|nr:choice-of-anchor L domain-containing protein [Edaphocola sp.]
MKKIIIFFTFWFLYSINSLAQYFKESSSNLKIETYLDNIPLTNNNISANLPRPTPEIVTQNIQGDGIQISNFSNSSYINLLSSPGSGIPVKNPFTLAKFFFDGPSDIGIDTGIVLSTGILISFNVQPNAPIPPGRGGIYWPSIYSSGHMNPMIINGVLHNGEKAQVPTSCFQGPACPWRCDVQDSDLNSLVNDSIVEASIIEFDFIPDGDSIALQYVFASEEYPNFSSNFSEPTFASTVCDSETDVMGIFLSGPGIQGSKNIALVPGTNLPVGLKTITPPGWACAENEDYSAYYVDNSEGQNVIYNGFTTVLTAKAAVTAGETYHLRIGVADVALHSEVDVGGLLSYGNNWGTGCSGTIIPRRGLFDSGIFIKSQSLVSWSDSTNTDTTTHVHNLEKIQFQINPNPFADNFQIKGSQLSGNNYDLIISNLMGTVIASFKGNLASLNQSLRQTTALTNQPKGIYAVQIRDHQTGRTGVAKLVKK